MVVCQWVYNGRVSVYDGRVSVYDGRVSVSVLWWDVSECMMVGCQ